MDKEWLTMCATAAEFLYGYFPVGVLRKMYMKKNGCSASDEELIKAMKSLQEEGQVLLNYQQGILDDTEDQGAGYFEPLECEGTALEEALRKADKEGNPFASIHFDEDERETLLSENIGNLEFYIPSKREITELYNDGFILTKQMQNLQQLLRKRGGSPESLNSLKEVWGKFCTDKLDQMEAINEIINLILNSSQGNSNGRFSSMDELNGIMSYVSDFLNSINIRARKGWKPGDLFKKMNPHGITEMPTLVPGSRQAAKTMMASKPMLNALGVNVEMSTIGREVTVGPHGERRVIKVGPNDPCPCGSGKKYKRCHGR